MRFGMYLSQQRPESSYSGGPPSMTLRVVSSLSGPLGGPPARLPLSHSSSHVSVAKSSAPEQITAYLFTRPDTHGAQSPDAPASMKPISTTWGWSGPRSSNSAYDHGILKEQLEEAQQKIWDELKRSGYLDGFWGGVCRCRQSATPPSIASASQSLVGGFY